MIIIMIIIIIMMIIFNIYIYIYMCTYIYIYTHTHSCLPHVPELAVQVADAARTLKQLVVAGHDLALQLLNIIIHNV